MRLFNQQHFDHDGGSFVVCCHPLQQRQQHPHCERTTSDTNKRPRGRLLPCCLGGKANPSMTTAGMAEKAWVAMEGWTRPGEEDQDSGGHRSRIGFGLTTATMKQAHCMCSECAQSQDEPSRNVPSWCQCLERGSQLQLIIILIPES